jgi:DNA-binding response OmpR family regulator
MSQADASRLILLVEDDESNAVTAAALLEDAGFSVDLANSLAMVRRLLPGRSYSLVLLDNRLSDGTGVELIPRLREHLPLVPIILVSGENHGELPAGVDAIFLKGADFGLLLSLIVQLLDASFKNAGAAKPPFDGREHRRLCTD